MNIHRGDLAGCVDCLAFVANGDIPDDRPNLPARIEQQWPAPLHVVTACEENCEEWFSCRPCQICGSKLGGDRHPFAVLCDHEECEEDTT